MVQNNEGEWISSKRRGAEFIVLKSFFLASFLFLATESYSDIDTQKRVDYIKERADYAIDKFDMPMPNILIATKEESLHDDTALGETECYQYRNGFVYCAIKYHPCIFFVRESLYKETINHELSHVGSFYEMLRNKKMDGVTHGPEWIKAMGKMGYKNPAASANLTQIEWDLCFPETPITSTTTDESSSNE